MNGYFNDTLNVFSGVAEVNEFPFPWGGTTECLPGYVYAELDASRPTTLTDDTTSNKRIDINAVNLLRDYNLPPVWRDFITYHTSTGFYHRILDKFEAYFLEFYPQLKGMRDYKTGVRFRDEADIFLECQLGINTPVTEKGTVAPPHVDNPQSLWASLLYMKEKDDNSGGNLVLNKCVRVPTFFGKRNVPSELVRPNQIIPYEPNSYVCFINSPLSVHSVTERDITDKQRLLVNITLEFNNQNLFNL